MKNKLFLTCVLASLSISANANTFDPWSEYQALATKINQQVNTASLNDLSRYSSDLTKLSTKLLPAFVAQKPVCKGYIEAAMAATDTMLSLSLEEIERDYHADGKLPPMKQAVCYHAKDLLVHPATVAVIANTLKDNKKTREMISHELEEVLEHFSEVKRNAGI